MSTNAEYDHLIFTQKLSYGDYLFVYADGNNNIFGLIHPTPDSEYTLEVYITDEDVVDTMGDDIMESMEIKNGNIYDDYDYIFGEEHEMDDETYSLSDSLEQITIYIYI